MAEHTYTGQNNLHLTVMKDHDAIAKAAAQQIADRLRKKPDLVIGLATGATMEPVYAELARMHKEEGLDFSKARFFNLDAYKGLPDTDRNAYANQLTKLLISKVNASPENVNFVSGINFNPEAYEEKIRKAGGIDIQLLGLGGEGHIGFNEVGSSINSRTREVALSERTLIDNAKYFNKPGEKMPEAAYTMGIGTILDAKEILVLANNANKAWAVRNIMEPTGTHSEDVTTRELFKINKLRGGEAPTDDVLEKFVKARKRDARNDVDAVGELPARALHAHNKVTFLVDEEAASMSRATTLINHSNLTPDQARDLMDKFSPSQLTIDTPEGKKNLLIPPKMDFYDPAIMDLDEKFDPKNRKHVDALARALQGTQEMGIGAHQDDVEIMAGPPLLKAVQEGRKWLTVIVTDGAASNSQLTGVHSNFTAQQLTDMRQREQREAAKDAGTPVIQLKYPSATVNNHMGEGMRMEAASALGSLMSAMPNLEKVYGHNPIDKHDTHLGTLAVQTDAIRTARPPKLDKVYGMEVWGGLSTLPESMLHINSVEREEDLHTIKRWIAKYVSQIEGQARDYADTTIGRMKGHGGYVSDPHACKPPIGTVIGVDLTRFTKSTTNGIGEEAQRILDEATRAKVKKSERFAVSEKHTLEGSYGDALLNYDPGTRQKH